MIDLGRGGGPRLACMGKGSVLVAATSFRGSSDVTERTSNAPGGEPCPSAAQDVCCKATGEGWASCPRAPCDDCDATTDPLRNQALTILPDTGTSAPSSKYLEHRS